MASDAQVGTGGTLSIDNASTLPASSSGVPYLVSLVISGSSGNTLAVVLSGDGTFPQVAVQPEAKTIEGTPA